MTTEDTATSVTRRGFLKTAASGAAVAAASGTAAAQSTVTVEVGPGGNYVFRPGTDDPLYITPGTTVKFVWRSDNHNIVVSSQPEGASWEGHQSLENQGFTYTHTFQTKGEYQYYCSPHRNLGMEGTIIVNESGQPPSTGGGGGPTLPESAKTIGIATSVAMLSTLSLAYFFLKYGGDYETPE